MSLFILLLTSFSLFELISGLVSGVYIFSSPNALAYLDFVLLFDLLLSFLSDLFNPFLGGGFLAFSGSIKKNYITQRFNFSSK